MKTKSCPTCKKDVEVIELNHIESPEIEKKLLGLIGSLKLVPFYCCKECGTMFIPPDEMK